MRQRDVETLITEEPDALIAHVRVCGGAGWATAGSTRNTAAEEAWMSITALQRTRPRLRFRMNLNGSGWGLAAEGEAFSRTRSVRENAAAKP